MQIFNYIGNIKKTPNSTEMENLESRSIKTLKYLAKRLP